MPRRLLFVLAAPVAATSLALAQDRSRIPPTFSVGLDVVNVTVSVRDDDGNLVTDLGPEDFVVREDGRPQKLVLFARAVEPGKEDTLALTLGLLMDTSESMLKELKLSQEAAVRFLEAIPRARDLLTIFFDHDIRVSRYDSENQQGLFERIMESKGGGGTALYDSIAVYLSRVDDVTGRKVLVLFTDGEDSTSRVSLGEVLQMLRSSSVTVYPIAFTGGFATGSARAVKSRAILQGLADLTGGQIFAPASSRDLAAIYQKILDELSAQYVLGFVSDNGRHDGRFRKLKVEVVRKDLKVRHRVGYTVPRDRSS